MKMLKVRILDTTLEAALLNPKTARRFDDGLKDVVAAANDSMKCTDGADAIEMQCNAVIKFVDDVFGPGSAQKVFGEETDLLTCLEAWEDLTNLYETQVNPIVREYEKRIGNRLQEKQGED